ncbi:50S ribosomal protein L11 methyltransferase [Helicobacter suis]|uniref:50S ribosomal protein L11 methyltransferase n=1 Tax=Helicobacter suis TaxID=104628 RepID=UPI0013D40532|nr:50S ribosomal protein L11 methyltransferase [Helicobacter suis]
MDSYFKTLVLPTGYPELFADFLLDFTQEAIEESSATNLSDLPYQYFGDKTHSLPTQAYIIYSSQEPSALLKNLKEFCYSLNNRGACVGVYHHTSIHKNQDWIKNYQQSIKPTTCAKFYITPSWIAPVNLPDLYTLILDPSLAFGTGHHESTRMLLKSLSRLDVTDKLALDVGCGSGILALALSKLGARVHACDTDLFALQETKKNFEKNRAHLERLWLGSLQESTECYDYIVINIVASVIIELYTQVLKASHAKTELFLSGILEEYAERVIGVYTSAFRLLERTQENEWVCLHLCKS